MTVDPMTTATKSKACPDCGSSMEIRKREQGGQIWGCTDYPRCRRAVVAYTSADIRRAKKILKHPLVKGSAASKLLKMLDDDPDRALPLVVGNETPTGAKTVQKILFERRRGGTKKKAKRVRRLDPLDGITLYDDSDLPSWADEGTSLHRITIPEEGGPTRPGSEFPYHKCPYETLNPIQSRALPWLSSNCNVVVAASTSAGKTFTAEGFMADALHRKGKAAFLSPLKAVSAEKHGEWSDENHPWGEKNISIITGDFSLTEARKSELRRAHVIVMTSEMLDSKTRRMESEKNNWLKQIMVLVVDEAHLLTMEGRGDALEAGLMRFTRQNPNARIVFLSATMPNVAQLGTWLTKLNGKPSVVIESSWRPTKLNRHVVTYNAGSGWGSYHKNEEAKRDVMLDLLATYPDDKWIVFVHSKKAGRALLEDVTAMGEEAVFHNADLDRRKRSNLEKAFKHGDLRIVIATSTLAWGINMPARRVGILGVHRGTSEVDPIDIAQMAGRAGRTDWGAEGDAFLLLPLERSNPHRLEELKEIYSTVGNIESVMNEEDTLAFHLTAEVAEGDVQTAQEAVSWHGRSLAAHQGKPIHQGRREGDAAPGGAKGAGDVLDRLNRVGIFSRTKRGKYEATPLGRVASWLYFSPFDIADWARNFRSLIERDQLYDDDHLAWALGAVKTAYETHLPRDLERDMADMAFRLKDKGHQQARMPAACLAFYGCLQAITFKTMLGLQSGLRRDAPRVLQAIELIDNHVLKGLGREYIQALGPRIQYGCNWTEADLCRLPGVGGKKAATLVHEGYDSISKVAESDKADIQAILGPKTGAKAWRAAREFVKEEDEDGEED